MKLHYLLHKIEYSLSLTYGRYSKGRISKQEVSHTICKNIFIGKMTTYWNLTRSKKMAPTMAPTLTGQRSTLLVRKLPSADPLRVFVGDLIILKDPDRFGYYLIRRLGAVEGDEVVTADEKETFVLDEDQCWVVSDNYNLNPKEAMDSRTFGPVWMTGIVGRVVYSLRTPTVHGPVRNSRMAMQNDAPVLAAELDIEEMVRTHEAKVVP